MTQPKFKVGEEVILQSNSYPDFNGDTVVIEVLPRKWRNNEKIGRHISHSYVCSIEHPAGTVGWMESSLKKKHPPADESLDQMIRRLNNRVKA